MLTAFGGALSTGYFFRHVMRLQPVSADVAFGGADTAVSMENEAA